MQSEEKTTYVALLRGVNVGGNSIVSMKALKESIEEAGFSNVSTYINSGNVIFSSKKTDARILEKKFEKVLRGEFAIDSKVVIRDYSQMKLLVERLPKTWDGNKDTRFYVIFLRHAVDSRDALLHFKPKKGIEEISYRPGAILWSAPLKTIARTSMSKLPSMKIFKDVTIRNLNTVRKLHELMKANEKNRLEAILK